MAVTSTPIEARAEQQNRGASFPFAGTNRFALAGARVLASELPEKSAPVDRDGFALMDILIDQGAIAAVAPAGRGQFGDAPIADLAGRIVLPLFVDAHTHLDKGHIWPRAANPTGDFAGALEGCRRRSHRPLDARATSPRAWTSVCARPTRMAPPPSERISTASVRKR